MKAFIAVIALFTIVTAQAATISAKALIGIESRIEIQREILQDKLSNFETDDIVEGKIVAAMVNQIESKLKAAEQALNSIASDEQLTEETVAEINSILDESERLIEEI